MSQRSMIMNFNQIADVQHMQVVKWFKSGVLSFLNWYCLSQWTQHHLLPVRLVIFIIFELIWFFRWVDRWCQSSLPKIKNIVFVAISWFLKLQLSTSLSCKYARHRVILLLLFNSKLKINVVYIANISNVLHI